STKTSGLPSVRRPMLSAPHAPENNRKPLSPKRIPGLLVTPTQSITRLPISLTCETRRMLHGGRAIADSCGVPSAGFLRWSGWRPEHLLKHRVGIPKTGGTGDAFARHGSFRNVLAQLLDEALLDLLIAQVP